MVNKDSKSQLLDFSRYFKNLYESRRLNKAELSRLSGVSDATLSRIESATQQPSPATLTKLAPVLLVTEKELMIRAGYIIDTEDEQDDPVITAIQRAAKKMTPQQKNKMLSMMKLAFEEAFEEE